MYDEEAPEPEAIQSASEDISGHVKQSQGVDTMEHEGKGSTNIFTSGGEGNGGATAAIIAALGNRNEKDSSMAAILPAMLMGGRNRDDGFGSGGFGAGLIGGVLGGLLFGNRRGGPFGGGDDCGGSAETRLQTNADTLAILAATGRVGDSVAAASATGTINLLQQTNEIQQLASANAALIAAGTAATERTVTNTGTVLLGAINQVNQNVLEQGCQTRAAVAASTTAILSKLDQNTIDDLRHRADRAERGIEINSLRAAQENHQTVTVTTNQVQAQAQVQSQFQVLADELRACRRDIAYVHQEARSTNANIIAGNAGAVTTGAQTSTPTNVNA